MTSSPYLHKRAATGTSAAFRHRMVVALLNRRKSLNPVAQGFTLVELMIVVAIVGILSAVALPNYLQARSAALIGSRVGEAVGFAKECAVLKVTGIGNVPNKTASTGSDGGVAITGCTQQAGAGSVTATWGGARAAGVRCLDKSSSDANTQAVINVATDGGLSCTFS